MAKIKITAQASDEQLLYANILEKGMLIGLVLMFITFALYVFRIMPAAVPLSEISGYWREKTQKRDQPPVERGGEAGGGGIRPVQRAGGRVAQKMRGL